MTFFAGGPVSPNGLLADGTITEPDGDDGCGWDDVGDVVRAVHNGYAYVNAHTLATPSGEIRDQLR